MDLTKESLKQFVREQVSELNVLPAWNMGLYSTDEIEPKLELLRRINRTFDLGISEDTIRDYSNRTNRI